MKTIFTYPNNAPLYIDPNYVGNDTSGWQQRIKALKEGNYLAWPGANPSSVPQTTIMTGTGKYHNAFEDDGGNNTIYQFWLQPMIECTMRAKDSISVTSMSLVNDGGIPKIKVTSSDDVSAFVLGTPLYGEGFTTAEMNEFDQNYPNAKYAVPIDTNNFYLAENSTGTQFDIDFLNQTIYNNKVNPSFTDGASGLPKSLRRDFSGVQGSIIKSQSAWNTTQYISDTDALQNLNLYTSSNNGTLNSLTPFYQTLMANTSFTIEAFTDSNKTTRATVEEKYVESAVKTFTATGDYVLTNFTHTDMINDWGMTQSQIDNLIAVEGTAAGFSNNYAEGWCRIYADVTSGTFVGKISADDTIPENAVSYEYEFYWKHNQNNSTFSFYDQRGSGLDAQDFRITGTNPVDVDIHVKFIECGMPTAGICPAYTGITTDAGATLIENGTQNKYEINTATIILPGAKTFTFQDTNNATQPGAQWEDNAGWLPGATSESALATGEIKPSGGGINLDSSGRLSSITFATGSGPERGTFDSNATRLFKLKSKTNTYVPPVPTPAELEDVWDTDDQWASYGFDTTKEWPTHVSPSSANITYNSPTVVNRSQSGIKYSRSAGHTKWMLEVEYPPMTRSDFMKFHAVAQAAQGQAMPFYFVLVNKDNTNILWRQFAAAGISSNKPRFKNPVATGDRLALLEGFASNEANVFIQGEVFINGNNENGYLHTVLNGPVESNVFGEAKIRTPWPFRDATAAGQIAYKNPFHTVVTLNSDNFEYSVDTAEYYYVNVAFDLDDWK